MVWPNVLVDRNMVESDDFTVAVGDTLTTALELSCEEWRPADGDEQSAGLRAGEYGSRLRVRGGLGIAEWHVIEEFDHRDAVLETAERPFVVRRILRRQAGQVWDVPAVGRAQPPGSDYLLTLAEG